MQSAIQATGLSKTYRLYHRPIDRLLELFFRRSRHQAFPALHDVSFEIAEGETIGLIGENGAGKSTLLKLLCEVTAPSSGSLRTQGTIASILELGTGFHPEFTGRDNAALNAAILGLGPAEIRQKLPSILEFSELGAFLDQPVKTYSSGMYMRLAFSVAVNVDPDILIVDEALAVGDGHFQKKCIDRIREFQQRGRTIIFCSHALYYISTLCSRAIWLRKGSVAAIGPAIDVVHEYETHLLQQDARFEKPESREVISSPVRIRDVRVTDAHHREVSIFSSGDTIHLEIEIDSDIPSQPLHILAGVLRAADEMQCFAVGTSSDELPPLAGSSHYGISLELRNIPLLRGDYGIVVYVGDEHAMHVFDRKDIRPAFSVAGDRYEIGLIRVDHGWQFQHEPAREEARGPLAALSASPPG